MTKDKPRNSTIRGQRTNECRNLLAFVKHIKSFDGQYPRIRNVEYAFVFTSCLKMWITFCFCTTVVCWECSREHTYIVLHRKGILPFATVSPWTSRDAKFYSTFKWNPQPDTVVDMFAYALIGIPVNLPAPGQNGHHFADDIIKCIFVNKQFRILIKFHWSLYIGSSQQ